MAVDLALAVTAFGIGVVLFLWGSDKTWLANNPNPSTSRAQFWGKVFMCIGVVYVVLGFIVAIVAA